MQDNHSKYHSPNAFCGSAGPEELEHLHDLVSELTDEELKLLVKKGRIEFQVGENELNRDDYLGVVDEIAREDFYREYKKIIRSKSKNNS